MKSCILKKSWQTCPPPAHNHSWSARNRNHLQKRYGRSFQQCVPCKHGQGHTVLTMAKYVLPSFCTHPCFNKSPNILMLPWMRCLNQGVRLEVLRAVQHSRGSRLTCMHARSTYKVFQFLGNHLERMQALSDTFQSVLEDAICTSSCTSSCCSCRTHNTTVCNNAHTGEHTIVCSVYIDSYSTSF